jgi:hypothetical protein
MNAAVKFPDYRFADAQAAADPVYASLGSGAPAPMAGEALLAYRVRLLRGLQKHSVEFKNVNLAAIAYADSATFDVMDKRILADAATFARSPQAVPDGQLRETTTRSPSGHMVTEYQGDPFVWMRVHMQSPKCVRITPPNEFRR